jgi:hypothetical protein
VEGAPGDAPRVAPLAAHPREPDEIGRGRSRDRVASVWRVAESSDARLINPPHRHMHETAVVPDIEEVCLQGEPTREGRGSEHDDAATEVACVVDADVDGTPAKSD